MIEYVGENLIAGQVGIFLIFLSFVASLLSVAFYYNSSELSLEVISWKKWGRFFFRLHSFAMAGLIGILFYLIYTHAFEYYYIWRHSSSDMSMKYIISSFWEGQEGSTMLWAFWNIVLGNVLIFTTKKWEGGVMTIYATVQVFLSAMLLGIFPFDIQIGSNPFILLREHADMFNLPFVSNPNYLGFVEGNGLNPLLQNYWMTIHPPTVFFGFATTLIPFAYALTALWKKSYQEWIKPALPWTFFGIGILGLGILMGGAWAYEALSFGGFWAWDPVENSSLVPWLVLVGAGHLMLINRTKMKSIFSAFALALFSFLLVVYSTYLTKSGILGETSVHSFADGLPGQLIIFLLFYLFVALFFLFKNGGQFLKKSEEDAFWSREFWMFLGALVLVISAFQITLSTSIPVVNALFGTTLAPPAKPIEHYNSWQIPLTILVTLFVAISQFLKYKKTEVVPFFKKIAPSFMISFAAAIIMAVQLKIRDVFLITLLFTSLFAVLANLDYLLRIIKGNVKKGGSAIAHVGFGLVILGSLLSAGNKKIISKNRTQVNINFEDNKNANNENVMLLRNDTILMDSYYITYTQRRVDGKNVYFDMDYLKVNEKGKYQKEFRLSPFVQLNEQMGNVPEPDTKHFIDKDIFTHITYADLENLDSTTQEIYRDSDTLNLKIGDSLFTSNSIIKLSNFERNIDKEKLRLLESDIALGVKITAKTLEGKYFEANPIMVIRGNNIFSINSEIDELGLQFGFAGIDPDTEKLKILLAEKNKNSGDFVIMQALVFPYINVLWVGIIVMVLGSLLAAWNRIRSNKSSN
ncbi:cytochrome c biogenesis protein CcsA [Vicingaceae bacterium]|nr:cytochrome c biogenesis protein CcsA [Vicingaceae bacterium]MDB4061995.1 cytochrome c biogenesis protein CcsA [Vicingaceae bacterium]